MFCTNCGSQIADTASFCVSCGARAPAPPPSYTQPPIPPPPSYAQPQPPSYAATPTSAAPTAKCTWCGAVVDASQPGCPACGATINMRGMVTRSGWVQLPGRKDMAKLQFGNSFCQIEGLYVPVADFNLAPTDSVYFAHHVLLWKDPQVNVTTMPLAGAWKRMFAGMPLIMTQAQGPGHIAFSRDAPGEMISVPIHPGQTIDVKEHLFLAATNNVGYDWFKTDVWFRTKSGDDTETHYPVGMFMDRFASPQAPGLLLLHAAGNVFIRQLGPGQTILIKPTALVFKDPTVQMHLHFEVPNAGFFGWGSWGNRYLWLRLIGPGRVAVQSVFDRIEGESRNITGNSYATQTGW
jgi:uncharacterized protein (AIM24 family)